MSLNCQQDLMRQNTQRQPRRQGTLPFPEQNPLNQIFTPPASSSSSPHQPSCYQGHIDQQRPSRELINFDFDSGYPPIQSGTSSLGYTSQLPSTFSYHNSNPPLQRQRISLQNHPHLRTENDIHKHGGVEGGPNLFAPDGLPDLGAGFFEDPLHSYEETQSTPIG